MLARRREQYMNEQNLKKFDEKIESKEKAWDKLEEEKEEVQ